MTEKKPRALWALRNIETGKFADFLFSDRYDLDKWKWVDVINAARWLTIDQLPAAFRRNDGQHHDRVTMTRKPAPQVGQGTFEELSSAVFGSDWKPTEQFEIERVQVHPGYEVE